MVLRIQPYCDNTIRHRSRYRNSPNTTSKDTGIQGLAWITDGDMQMDVWYGVKVGLLNCCAKSKFDFSKLNLKSLDFSLVYAFLVVNN